MESVSWASDDFEDTGYPEPPGREMHMPRKQADEFLNATIIALRERVNGICSNPYCRKVTLGPKKLEGVNRIGQAAHIRGATPGSARYDKSMSSPERRHFDNGIWLCNLCAKKIDNDEDKYPVKLLVEWKKATEQYIQDYAGKSFPSESEALQTLTQGLVGYPRKYLPDAIARIHKVSAESLSELDPRFWARTSFVNGQSSVELGANENVQFSIKVQGESTVEFASKMTRLQEHGTPLIMRTDDIRLEGSALFDLLFNDEPGELKISSDEIGAIQKIWITDPVSGTCESFDDIHGRITVGTSGFTFHGTACGGILEFGYRKSFHSEAEELTVTIGLATQSWERAPLEGLSYLGKLVEFFGALSEGRELSTQLEVGGVKILASTPGRLDNWNWGIDTSYKLKFLYHCGILSRRFGLGVRYRPDFEFTAADYNYVLKISRIIREEGRSLSQTNWTLSSDSTIGGDKSIFLELKNDSSGRALQIIEPPTAITMLGQNCEIPELTIYISLAVPTIERDIASMSEGEKFSIGWQPTAESQILYSFRDFLINSNVHL